MISTLDEGIKRQKRKKDKPISAESFCNMASKTPKSADKDQHGTNAHAKLEVRTGSKSLSAERARKVPKGAKVKMLHE